MFPCYVSAHVTHAVSIILQFVAITCVSLVDLTMVRRLVLWVDDGEGDVWLMKNY